MLTEVDYGKSPAFMSNAELKQEIWKLKGLIDSKDKELTALRHAVNTAKVKVIYEAAKDSDWEMKYRRLLASYNSLKENKSAIVISSINSHDSIINSVLSFYNVTMDELKSSSRRRQYVRPRHVLCFLLHRYGMSLSDIGGILNRDHSSAIHGRDCIFNEMSTFKKEEQDFIRAMCDIK